MSNERAKNNSAVVSWPRWRSRLSAYRAAWRSDSNRSAASAAAASRPCQSAPRSAGSATPKPAPGGKATIRSTVSLVEIDVQVTNRDGKPIKGLKQEQFSVTEDGKPQKISTFEYNDIERIETAGKGGRGADHGSARDRHHARRKSRPWCAITA